MLDPYQATNDSQRLGTPQQPQQTKMVEAPKIENWHSLTLTERAEICKRYNRSYKKLHAAAGPAPRRKRKPLYASAMGGRSYRIVSSSERI